MEFQINSDTSDTIKLKITGEIEISRRDFSKLFPEIKNPQELAAPNFSKIEKISKLPRLAFTTRETAEILGVSPVTVYRLIVRGLLKSSTASRTKIISKAEIERFLRETTKAAW
jgi:excisionase family DNA binding protein